MKIIKIRKKSGGYRTVYVPDSSRKKYLSSLLSELNDLQLSFLAKKEVDMMSSIRLSHISSKNHFCMPIVHGFMPKRSPVTNAIVHENYQISICFDISNCFDSTTIEVVKEAAGENNKVTRFINRHSWALFEDSAARQGLPTSPALANIALSKIDFRIVKILHEIWTKALPNNFYFDKEQNRGVAFDIYDFINIPNKYRKTQFLGKYYFAITRYADDITISTNNYDLLNPIISGITACFDDAAFNINLKKTRVQDSKFGNRIITGVSVGAEISPSRRTRRKLRAALHQSNIERANGLAEWCKLKIPC